jgi:nickel superoxide dismutase
MHRTLILFALPLLCVAFSHEAFAHCQVPCGIYDDHARIHAMEEDTATIGKAVANIDALSGLTDAKSKNQLIRWVQAKEKHASHIIQVTAEYFLTQKIKPAKQDDRKAWKTYVDRLVACHAVMRAAMKTKQSVSTGNVSSLRQAIDDLGAFYPPAKK